MSSTAASIRELLKPGFQQALFDATLLNLKDAENPLQLTNFANGLRELFRHVCEGFATDEDVKKCSWFVPDETSRNGVTRLHRYSYIVHGGFTREYAESVLDVEVQEELAVLKRGVDRLNKFTHVSEKVFGLPDAEVTRASEEGLVNLLNLLELAEGFRRELSEAVTAKVQHETLLEAARTTIDDIDILATCYVVKGVGVEEVVSEVGPERVKFRVLGYVEVELLYGSSSERGRGDGAEITDSFPLTCEFESPVEDLDAVSVVEGSLAVDTSSWWE